MNTNLKLAIWNSRGIRKKLYEFFEFLLGENIDICLVSETWLNGDIAMYHPEFICYRKDRLENRVLN